MNKKMKLTISILTALFLSFLVVDCAKANQDKQDNPTLSLYLIAQRTNFDSPNQRKCVYAYGLANSCVGGNQFFNPGIGCVSPNVKTEATYDALINCVTKAVNDPVQPCNMPQFKYGLAAQALAGAFASCNAKFTPSGGTETDLSGALRF